VSDLPSTPRCPYCLHPVGRRLRCTPCDRSVEARPAGVAGRLVDAVGTHDDADIEPTGLGTLHLQRGETTIAICFPRILAAHWQVDDPSPRWVDILSSARLATGGRP